MESAGPELAVGAVVVEDDCLLMVRRGHAPGAGEWSVPGGRVRDGESVHEALVREVGEETGLAVVVDDFLGWLERIGDSGHFVILDFRARVMGGELEAGDDAEEARWIPLADLGEQPTVDGLIEFLVDVGVLPGPTPLGPWDQVAPPAPEGSTGGQGSEV